MHATLQHSNTQDFQHHIFLTMPLYFGLVVRIHKSQELCIVLKIITKKLCIDGESESGWTTWTGAHPARLFKPARSTSRPCFEITQKKEGSKRKRGIAIKPRLRGRQSTASSASLRLEPIFAVSLSRFHSAPARLGSRGGGGGAAWRRGRGTPVWGGRRRGDSPATSWFGYERGYPCGADHERPPPRLHGRPPHLRLLPLASYTWWPRPLVNLLL